LAGNYLTQLLTKFPRNENRVLALLARAGIEEANYDFDSAVRDYRDYLASVGNKAKASERQELTRRLFFLTWLSRHPTPLNCKPYSDVEEVLNDCERYQSLVSLQLGATDIDGSELVKRAAHGAKENRVLWAAVGLQLGKKIGLRDRLNLAGVLAANWKSQDALLQFALIPVMNRALPEAFASSRRSLSQIASLKSNSKEISRRINLIRDLENAAGKVLDAPWAQVKVAVLGEVAQAYLDFCDELAKLPVPKELSGDDLVA
jgi:hypothetical protein